MTTPNRCPFEPAPGKPAQVHGLIVLACAFARGLAAVGRFWLAANRQPRQAIAKFGLFLSEHPSQFFQVVAALSGDLFADTPDFFQKVMFHSLTIP